MSEPKTSFPAVAIVAGVAVVGVGLGILLVGGIGGGGGIPASKVSAKVAIDTYITDKLTFGARIGECRMSPGQSIVPTGVWAKESKGSDKTYFRVVQGTCEGTEGYIWFNEQDVTITP